MGMKTITFDPTMAADPEIIMAVRCGERERFGEIVERYQRMLYAVAWSRLRRDDLSEDVVQETFLQAYRYLPLLRDPSRLPGWMARIARNLAISVSKKRARDERVLSTMGERMPLSTPAASSISNQPWDVEKALAEIPDKYREALVLFYVEEKSVRECAAMLGVSETAFKTRLHRARTTMKSQLEETVESDLRSLGSRTEMKARVMAAIPAVPMAGKAGGAAGLGAMAKSLLLKLLFPLLQFGMTFGMVAWMNTYLARNYRPDEGVRKRSLQRNYFVGLTTVGLSLVAFYLIGFKFGMRGAFMGMGLLMFVYRSNRSLAIFSYQLRVSARHVHRKHFRGGHLCRYSVAGTKPDVVIRVLSCVERHRVSYAKIAPRSDGS